MSWKRTVVMGLVWLAVVNVFALLVANRFNLKTDSAYSWINSSFAVPAGSWNPVPMHSHWDSDWYVGIAQYGYHVSAHNTLSNVVFFPLYPLLVKVFGVLLFHNYALAGWLISSAALLLALVMLVKLIQEFHPDVDAERAVWLLLLFPTAFFLNAVYTESLYLLLSVSTFYFLFKKRYVLTGVFGMLAALTRLTGVVLLVPALWEWWQAHRQKLKQNDLLSAAPLLFIPLGTLLFFTYHYIAFGSFTLFFKVEKAWGRGFHWDASQFHALTHPSVANLILDLGFLVAAAVLLYLVWKRTKPSYAIYAALSLALPLTSGSLMSIGRYELVIFPFFIILATIKSKNFDRYYPLVSVLLLALYTTLFVNGYWAG